ncbi:putative GTP-binding protein EngB [Oxobacter pfennigii]|uniref:Probable GTP-binding protein EngB n=1 Tax=Oxobacter pfennigii TaxID=36849 RepID=A0A0P8WE92_9CLOT|nr:ribosome biogenesis GTP-binding protein YihA/YsxC [Oxobacter pfennigii]KPU46043.1 putative GTP-binding protein EngB [Oxobacter pfennigii]
MIIRKADFFLTAVLKSQYPLDDRPEFAFVGRSNVGKSSLINSMVNRKGLARTSSDPGKTRTINFFNINDFLYFVDLPGYGYARVSKTEKASWSKIIEDYLYTRNNLFCVVLLVDIRHEPTDDDKIMYDWIKARDKKVVVVATKADKISKGQYQKHISIIKKKLVMDAEDTLILFSSETKYGREELWGLFDNMLGIDEPFRV